MGEANPPFPNVSPFQTCPPFANFPPFRTSPTFSPSLLFPDAIVSNVFHYLHHNYPHHVLSYFPPFPLNPIFKPFIIPILSHIITFARIPTLPLFQPFQPVLLLSPLGLSPCHLTALLTSPTLIISTTSFIHLLQTIRRNPSEMTINIGKHVHWKPDMRSFVPKDPFYYKHKQTCEI